MRRYLPLAAGLLLLAGPLARGGYWPLVAGRLEAVVIVEETAARTPATAAIVASKALRDECLAKGIAFRVADKDAGGPDVSEIQWALDAAQSARLPAMCFRRGGKSLVKLLPVTEAEAVKLLRSQGG